MHEITLDTFDFKLLDALQENGRLTNNELAEIINLSPSQCSRRRLSLEENGVITGYKAKISPDKAGQTLVCFTSITLSKHSENNAEKFKRFCMMHKEIQGAYSLTGNYDYLLKIAVKDLKALSDFINSQLLTQEMTLNVHSSIVLDVLKEM